MKNLFRTISILLVLVIVNPINLFGFEAELIKNDRFLSFEDSSIPPFITTKNGDLSLSKVHYKDGVQSLRWKYSPNSILSIKKDLHFEKKDPAGVDTYLSTFTVWLYNEKASDNKVEFQFLKDGKVCTSFAYNINFTGWRAVYVSYERDMEGTPLEGMNEIVVKSPEESGILYFDMLLTASKTDHRHHTNDIHQPFVNKDATNHWLIIYKNSLIAPDESLYKPDVSEAEKREIALMEERLRELIVTKTKVTDKSVENLEKRFDKYKIKKENGIISGLPLFYIYYAEVFERLLPKWEKAYHRKKGQEYREYFTLMQQIANQYANSTEQIHKDKLQDMFLLMYDHAQDQGVAYGSNMGNFSHYGYSFRGFFTSYFLMKDVLKKNRNIDETAKSLQWYAQTNETFIRPLMNGIDMDSFNTLSMGRICSILIMDNSPEKVQYIRAFSRWIDTGCKPAQGLNGAFKTDGGAFHHRNNYPAYAVGGLDGATNMLYILSRTSFAVSELGHQTVKNVLLTMRFYCNMTYFPLSMSGRHPDGKGELIPIHFARMAMSGTPNGENEIDTEMAASYLRLTSAGKEKDVPEYMPKSNKEEHLRMINLFRKNNISAEEDPIGNKALGYGCVSIHRRDNWSAVVRGHSRYLWAAEHYRGANLYGRYLAHGSMQIMTASDGETVSPHSSGWIQEGFDWGRIPGTTAIHLPVEELKANVLNVDAYSGYEEMLYSDEAFAGGLSQNGENGLFAMKLHEHDKYNGSHRARKSYHFFDNKIICLGSGIENVNTEYNTETTIFQLSVNKENDRSYWDKYKSDNEYWVDHLGTGYYIPSKSENKLVFEKNFPQKSRYQNTGEPTSGDWVNLVVDHGKSPKGASYEYVVLPKSNTVQKENIKKSYDVIRKDTDAHIVKDKQTNTTSFAFFETPTSLHNSVIAAVDTSCLVMLKEQGDQLVLTVSNPDLALYRGESDEAFDQDGKRIERSIYSRPWIENESQEIPVNITLKGEWIIKDNDGYILIQRENKRTQLTFKCKDAASINVELERR